ARSLAKGEAKLELRGGLMDLVDDQRVLRADQIILKPAAGYSRRNDDDVPTRSLRRRLPFAIDYADPEREPDDLGSDRPDRESFPRARTGDDPEPSTRGGQTP